MCRVWSQQRGFGLGHQHQAGKGTIQASTPPAAAAGGVGLGLKPEAEGRRLEACPQNRALPASKSGGRRPPLVKVFLVLLGPGGGGGGGFLAWLWSSYSREADSFLTLFALRVPKTITKVLDRNAM
ncbi:MAG: hypothetical protein IPL96_17630 [Holophagaceae bacterium]|nr:hypothetical protein [Holophagaceae bacterium]